MRLSVGVLPSSACGGAGLVWPIARCDLSPGSDYDGPPKSVGARVCLSGRSGVSAASSGGRGGGGGTKFVLTSGSGMAGVPVLTSGERCVLAASELVGVGRSTIYRISFNLLLLFTFSVTFANHTCMYVRYASPRVCGLVLDLVG